MVPVSVAVAVSSWLRIPIGINEIRKYDEPTFNRKGLSLAPTQDYDTDQDTQRIEKSNPDRHFCGRS